MVTMFSGCRDDQTSADANIAGRSTGAMVRLFNYAHPFAIDTSADMGIPTDPESRRDSDVCSSKYNGI